VQLHRDRTDLAVPLLEAAVTRSPDDPERLYHLGVGYLRAGRTDDARRSLTRALAADRPFAGRAEAEAALSALAARGGP
jgi:Flp pilus assembly protein TadD